VEGWVAGGLLLLAGLAVAAAVRGLRRERKRREAVEEEARQLLRSLEYERQARRTQEAWIGSLAGASGDPLLVVDSGLRLMHANAAARDRFGEPAPNATLIAFSQSLALEDIAREALAQTGEVERVLEIRDHPYRARALASGAVVAIALEDRAEVRRLSRARQDLVANLSHELRTPLASLQLLAETLASPVAADPAIARDLAGRVLDEVQALNQMTQEMLDLTAIESGRQVVRLVPVPLSEIVAESVARLREPAARKGLQLQDDVTPDLRVLADRDQAARAIQNVLHNAVKFAPQGGRVSLSAAAEGSGEHIVLRVTDDGPGIAPADLDRIFERFYRADQARGTPGTGLGLAITRHILQAHGGDVWAENRTPPANGAVIHLRFLAG
jgi:two-component system phosphate regulon sensor histidine kinase PhoR